MCDSCLNYMIVNVESYNPTGDHKNVQRMDAIIAYDDPLMGQHYLFAVCFFIPCSKYKMMLCHFISKNAILFMNI